jgi:hypothetical protein
MVFELPDGSGFFVAEIGDRPLGLINRLKYNENGFARRWLYFARNYRTARVLSREPDQGPPMSIRRSLWWAWSVSFSLLLALALVLPGPAVADSGDDWCGQVVRSTYARVLSAAMERYMRVPDSERNREDFKHQVEKADAMLAYLQHHDCSGQAR